MFAGNFAPAGWALCNGQLLPISEYEVLFQLIGTTYGGDGEQSFGVPNLQGRVPIHMGQGTGLSSYIIGEQAGAEQVSLNINQIPNHNHAMLVSLDAASSTNPQNQVIAQSSQIHLFTEDVANKPMNTNSLTPAGGNQPHDNMQPYVCLNFIIATVGLFPSQN